MDDLEMDGVQVVLGHVLHVDGHLDLEGAGLGPFGIAELGDLGHFPIRGLLLGVVPNKNHSISLTYLPGPNPGIIGNAFAIRNLDAFSALAIVLPGVEGAAHALTHHAAALGKMRSQVGAEGREHPGLPGSRAEENHLLFEIVDAPDFAGAEITAPSDRVPAVGDSRDVVLIHRFLSLLISPSNPPGSARLRRHVREGDRRRGVPS